LPSSAVTLNLNSDHTLLQPEQELARFFRRKGFYINAAKLVKDALVDGVEERELGGQRAATGPRGGAPQRVPPLLEGFVRGCGCGLRPLPFADLFGEHVQLVALEPGENLARARENRGRQAGEARHLDAVGLRRTPALDAVEEDDLAL